MERRERRNAVTVLAPAKLNLALDVVGLLPNGYHALDMTMQTITLYERVMLRRSAGLSLRLPGSLVQPNDKNTAIKRRWRSSTTPACWRGWISPSTKTPRCGRVWRAAAQTPPPCWWV